MINFALSREVFGKMAWMMDVYSVPVMNAILQNFRNGVKLEIPEIKLNTPSIVAVSDRKVITRPYGPWWNPGQLDNDDKFEGVAVINLNGPITKSGGMSSIGMEQLSNFMLKVNQDKRIKGFVMLVDSGGGSASGVQIMADTIKTVTKTKPVNALITKGGMAASAAYGISSAASTISVDNDEMAIVGSLGTMVMFEGKEANSKDRDGNQAIRLYATKSTAKNKAYEEALNNANYSVMINEYLDPINERFLSMIESNRPQVKTNSEWNTGQDFFAKDAVGSLIDGFMNFDEVVEMTFNDAKTNTITYAEKKSKPAAKNVKPSINLKSKPMTKAELKNEHPEVYASIVEEGIQAERDRAGAWLAHIETDSKAVIQGVESGENISQSQREKFFVSQNNKKTLGNMQSNSTEDFTTDESKSPEQIAKTAEQKELDEAFNFELS